MPPPAQTPPPPPPPQPDPPPPPPTGVLSSRSARQFGLFAVGAGFMLGSILVSRRAVARRQAASMPRFHSASVPPEARTMPTRLRLPAGSTTAAIAPAPSTPAPAVFSLAASARHRPAPASAVAAEEQEPGEDGPDKDWRGEGSLMALEALNLATLNILAFAVMMTGGVAWALDISSVDELRQRARRSMYGPGAVLDSDAEREIEEWAAGVLLRMGVVKEGDLERKQRKGEDEEGGDAKRKPGGGREDKDR